MQGAAQIKSDLEQVKLDLEALDALRDLSSPRALVIRNGLPKRIAGREVVRGDIMMLAEGDYFRYNRLVSEYNTWVGDYNQDLEVYQKISDEYSRLAEHYNYIISHEHDREGTYRYLFGEQW